MRYKYSIKQRMRELTYDDYKDFKKDIVNALGKTMRTFERYCSIKADEKGDIPTRDLDIIALLLKCTADELKNDPITNMELQKIIFKNQFND